MDKKVGEVLSRLKDNGLDKKTIVIYNSDHGGVLPVVSVIFTTLDYIAR